MEKEYYYLKNPLAVEEISRHRWIESEKAGRDVGFILAANDWINKYGEQWRRFHESRCPGRNLLVERRSFRRFRWDTHAKLVDASGLCFAKVVNLSFLGLLCRTPHYYDVGSRVRLHLPARPDSSEDLMCIASVERVVYQPKSYEVYLRFDEECLRKILNEDFLRKAAF